MNIAEVRAELALLETCEMPALYKGLAHITSGEDWREFAHRVVPQLCASVERLEQELAAISAQSVRL